MSAPRPFETSLLDEAAQLIADAVSSCSWKPQFARNVLLACVAAEFSGLKRGRVAISWFTEFRLTAQFGRIPAQIAEAILASRIAPALAVASLAQPLIPESERRKNGAYYTDFRLANYAASMFKLRPGQLLLDSACGTGILLAAAVLQSGHGSATAFSELIGSSVCGADLSLQALKGTLLSLATLTDDAAAIRSVAGRLRSHDSLLQGADGWFDCAPSGFDFVIGNPPWEKLKVTRHEWLRASGSDRHYGQNYDAEITDGLYKHAQNQRSSYARRLEQSYKAHGGGEQDLFKFFLELSLNLCRPSGHVVLLLPAGLIRSQGTAELRRFAFDKCSDVELTILENRARFFSIDTRFKFLTFHGTPAPTGTRTRKNIRLVIAKASERQVDAERVFSIPRTALEKIRADLSVPEVRSAREWQIFQDFSAKGVRFGNPDGPWRPKLMREVDMTRDRPHFRPAWHKRGTVPIIEGRMVHQFRLPAKRYISGTGRRARWDSVPEGADATLCPQFRFPRMRLPERVQERVSTVRAGFCDITGQTNERTMLASRIPAEAVCGNKVPTVIFGGEDQLLFVDCWLAVVNSIPFDWMLRRVVTTTVNYFLLLDLPLPVVAPTSIEGRRLVSLARKVLEDQRLTHWQRGELRAEIDWRVVSYFSHDASTLEVLLRDFPLLDRAQPPLPNETRSTISADLLLLRAGENVGGLSRTRIQQLEERVYAARDLGATPYVPSHLDDSLHAVSSE